MNIQAIKTQSIVKIAAVAALVISVLSPVVLNSQASAAQVTSRYVKMSSSLPSATSVNYEIGFTPTATSFQSLVVDFCNSATGPIIGATCSGTAGTDIPQFTGAASPGTGGTGTVGGWTASTLSNGQIKLNGSANASATAQVFVITGVTNPSATASFYARIYTFSNASYGTYASAASPGNYIDFGGFALSTSTIINISAKVQEQLIFCVSKAAPGSSCSGLTAPDLALGHGTNVVLDSTATDTDSAYFQVSTNASGNVVVRMKGTVLTSGSSTIPATPAGTNTPFSITPGTAQFGMQIQTAGANTTPDSNYDGTVTTTDYGFDVTTGSNNAVSGYGDPIATITAVQNSNTQIRFAATASLTTPAGLYTATENLIATGTY